MSQENAFKEVLRIRSEIHAAVGNEIQIQHWLDDFEKAVRHEAAERLRKHADRMTNREWATGALIGANLIDPYVK